VISDPYKERLSVRYQPFSAIQAASVNPRTHSEAQIAQLAASMQAFGFTNPILVDENNTIIAGHGRLAAASKTGLTEVPTIALLGLTDEQKRALVIADNKLAMNAGWDEELLRLELGSLVELDFDVSAIGFSEMELDQLLAEPIDPAGEWQGMPEFDHAPKAHRSIVMHFKTSDVVQQFAALIGQSITEQTRYLWYPEQEREALRERAFETHAT
jgi:ParB-like chromosome segregation protein Spo0J